MRRFGRVFAMLCLLTLRAFTADAPTEAAKASPELRSAAGVQFVLTGYVVDGAGISIPGATLSTEQSSTTTKADGAFSIALVAGSHTLKVEAVRFDTLSLPLTMSSDTEMTIQMGRSSTVNVVASADEPDTARVYSASELLANPARPGAPLAIPGFPTETASGGVKAPQYFAPGIAGDHGQPVAQYIRVGDFLFPNNLPANAHGNGYADPNLLIPASIGNVETDAGAFDVRHGNNAVNLAVAYELRPRVEPFVQFSGDAHDYDFATGWSPHDPQTGAWLGAEVSGGNGFLVLPENRRQYKLSGERLFILGRHQLTIFGAGYYGYSRIPGLVPINSQVPGDTIDPRQADRTQTAVFVASDAWQISDRRQLQFSAFLRHYDLDLKSDFGHGLIGQSETRSVRGGSASYEQKAKTITLRAGLDLRQDVPRNAELARADGNGIFQPVTLNDFSIGDVASYASLHGPLGRCFSYNLGVRRDEILFNNLDRLIPANSYQDHSAQTSPRATFSFHAPDQRMIPILSLSYGEAFHTNDPRIGEGTSRGTPIATSRAYQLLAAESLAGTEFRLTLSRTVNSQELAKIDPDTGLQENVGPSLVQAFTFSAHRRFSFGSLRATFARAQAKNRLTGEDIPEAPRLIWDLSATAVRLPARLRASGEFEYVGRKPLGDGFSAVPMREIRGALTRSFHSNLLEVGVHFLLASGYTGQTLETLQLPYETIATERIVGVRNPTYAGIGFTYHLRSISD